MSRGQTLGVAVGDDAVTLTRPIAEPGVAFGATPTCLAPGHVRGQTLDVAARDDATATYGSMASATLSGSANKARATTLSPPI